MPVCVCVQRQDKKVISVEIDYYMKRQRREREFVDEFMIFKTL